jgi:hypothetical protein
MLALMTKKKKKKKKIMQKKKKKKKKKSNAKRFVDGFESRPDQMQQFKMKRNLIQKLTFSKAQKQS